MLMEMALFIKEIVRREEHKIGGNYPKFTTKKLIVKTHSGTATRLTVDMNRMKRDPMDDQEFSDFNIKIMDVSAVTGENVEDVSGWSDSRPSSRSLMTSRWTPRLRSMRSTFGRQLRRGCLNPKTRRRPTRKKST